MEVWIADMFDYSSEAPFIVGVYDSEEKAWAAIQIVIDRILEVNPKTNINARFVRYVTPVQINSFAPACVDWCYSG